MQRELDRFVALIAEGQPPARVLQEIKQREAKIEQLDAGLERHAFWLNSATPSQGWRNNSAPPSHSTKTCCAPICRSHARRYANWCANRSSYTSRRLAAGI